MVLLPTALKAFQCYAECGLFDAHTLVLHSCWGTGLFTKTTRVHILVVLTLFHPG